ncbi:MAG: hypothetical protein AB1916_04590 [Thermodesulfobacteriota bacterium]
MRLAAEPAGPVLLLALLALFCAGCAPGASGGAALLWPDLGDPYVRLTRDWTRTAELNQGLDSSLNAAATLQSAAWREAFAKRWAHAYALTPGEAGDFLEEQRKAHARGTEIVLSLAAERSKNAVLRPDDPLWRVVVVQGESVHRPLDMAPLDKDRWPAEKIGLFFPYASRWRSFYGLRFPRLADGPATLVVSGPLGRMEFTWEHFE